MLTAEECRRRSEECKRGAAKAEDPFVRTTLQQIAGEWNGLTEYLAGTHTA
jgi:hypothetical protein